MQKINTWPESFSLSKEPNYLKLRNDSNINFFENFENVIENVSAEFNKLKINSYNLNFPSPTKNLSVFEEKINQKNKLKDLKKKNDLCLVETNDLTDNFIMKMKKKLAFLLNQSNIVKEFNNYNFSRKFSNSIFSYINELNLIHYLIKYKLITKTIFKFQNSFSKLINSNNICKIKFNSYKVSKKEVPKLIFYLI